MGENGRDHMMWFPKRDDDNTPQGKMAHGCMCMIWFAIAIVIFIGSIDATLEYFWPDIPFLFASPHAGATP